MYECVSYRGVLIAALIPLLASVPLRSRGSRCSDETKSNVDAAQTEQPQQAARDQELEREEKLAARAEQVRIRHMAAVLDAWESDQDRSCPNSVDELDRYTVTRHARDHRKLWCSGAGIRYPTILMVDESDGTSVAFDPGEVRPRSHRQDEIEIELELKLKRHNPQWVTWLKLRWYEFEAYPAWARAHPGRECPANLDELNAYIELSNSRDFWGYPMAMQCGPQATAGFTVSSPGEDGRFGTEDDIGPY